MTDNCVFFLQKALNHFLKIAKTMISRRQDANMIWSPRVEKKLLSSTAELTLF